jgi:predicted nucleic acid-binding protein
MILDTNIISEPLKPEPNFRVMDWLNEQDITQFYTTTINLAEVFFGVEILPEGKQKRLFKSALSKFFDRQISSRILPFDVRAAQEYVSLVASARRRGHTISFADGQIAAIASVNGFPVVTRDESPFHNLGISVVNPWCL